MMKADSFSNRYIIKLLSSIFIALFNLVIQFILPRAFTIEEYGFYTYNLNVFTSVVVMANLSTSDALVAKFSKRNDEIGIVLFYLKLFSVMTGILNIGILALYNTSIIQETFIGQTLLVVLLGLETAIVTKLLTDCVSICDAFSVSRFPAILQIIMKASISCVVLVGFAFHLLSLVSFYIIQLIITGVTLSVILIAIIKEQKKRYPQKIKKINKEYLIEYFIFCRPLVVSTAISQLIVIIMNWTLMKWSGAKEQALFGAAWQLNTLVGYVFSPYAELLKREFAVIHQNNCELIAKFLQALRLMMWLTSYFAIYIGFTSDWILPILYGDKYAKAGTITLIIMFYTIYQAWGQVSGSYMLALEQTKLNAVLTIIGQIVTLICVLLFQIPNYIWTDSLGAIGIALTYLLPNIISTITKICIISKSLNISMLKTNGIAVAPIGICTFIMIILKIIFNKILPYSSVIMLGGKIIASGVIYTLLISVYIFSFPKQIGTTRKKIVTLLRRGKK